MAESPTNSGLNTKDILQKMPANHRDNIARLVLESKKPEKDTYEVNGPSLAVLNLLLGALEEEIGLEDKLFRSEIKRIGLKYGISETIMDETIQSLQQSSWIERVEAIRTCWGINVSIPQEKIYKFVINESGIEALRCVATNHLKDEVIKIREELGKFRH